ncbi:hypothetical protein T4E_6151 [Trichinella pseudospiralis]|uniref:Uncharacterized protein n=1 Tax=Trichinella pseudospiralis TaxID=6337 RepID=A0A0V0WC00_TRIPS|nr:hypothetical protein T4E_6151 [Trichinella pseudospiralis]
MLPLVEARNLRLQHPAQSGSVRLVSNFSLSTWIKACTSACLVMVPAPAACGVLSTANWRWCSVCAGVLFGNASL